MSEITKWDLRFYELANFVAEWSKDINKKTGAVIVGPDNTEKTFGYNGFPRGANDEIGERYQKPLKYLWTEHAERNAILKAAKEGLKIDGCSMYVTYFPCSDCARAIIQSGIPKVYSPKPDVTHHKWGKSWEEAILMFTECNVEIIWLD